jgi:hypothetical protein
MLPAAQHHQRFGESPYVPSVVLKAIKKSSTDMTMLACGAPATAVKSVLGAVDLSSPVPFCAANTCSPYVANDHRIEPVAV